MMRRALLLVCCWLGGLLAIHAALADSLRQRSNMHNRKESVSSYRKGIDLLLTVDDKPSTIADLYSYRNVARTG